MKFAPLMVSESAPWPGAAEGGDRISMKGVHAQAFAAKAPRRNIAFVQVKRFLFMAAPSNGSGRFAAELRRQYRKRIVKTTYPAHAKAKVVIVRTGCGATKKMIMVSPDTFSLHNGSFYSNSKTTGDLETFIDVELMNYIDTH
jgi:hypothetical protein